MALFACSRPGCEAVCNADLGRGINSELGRGTCLTVEVDEQDAITRAGHVLGEMNATRGLGGSAFEI